MRSPSRRTFLSLLPWIPLGAWSAAASAAQTTDLPRPPGVQPSYGARAADAWLPSDLHHVDPMASSDSSPTQGFVMMERSERITRSLHTGCLICARLSAQVAACKPGQSCVALDQLTAHLAG